MNVLILYGTETGTAEMVAEDLASDLAADHAVEVLDMKDAGPAHLSDENLVLIVSSTYGDGEVPASAKAFHAALVAERPSLSGVRFAVFGLGDSSYATTFNHGGLTFETLLADLGGIAVAPRGVYDASGGDMPEDVARAWLAGVLAAVGGSA